MGRFAGLASAGGQEVLNSGSTVSFAMRKKSPLVNSLSTRRYDKVQEMEAADETLERVDQQP